MERGARVIVGDSPAFGTAQAIAEALHLPELLRPLSVDVITLDRGVSVKSANVPVKIAAQALEADLILNLPKFKAHSQMRLSGAVKNLYGYLPVDRPVRAGSFAARLSPSPAPRQGYCAASTPCAPPAFSLRSSGPPSSSSVPMKPPDWRSATTPLSSAPTGTADAGSETGQTSRGYAV
ncbi:MAG: DUF362 domain-containing protein [Clostridia bacterium]|nr:DUF362 domain-containing protein [Clostridia bacterium]